MCKLKDTKPKSTLALEQVKAFRCKMMLSLRSKQLLNFLVMLILLGMLSLMLYQMFVLAGYGVSIAIHEKIPKSDNSLWKVIVDLIPKSNAFILLLCFLCVSVAFVSFLWRGFKLGEVKVFVVTRVNYLLLRISLEGDKVDMNDIVREIQAIAYGVGDKMNTKLSERTFKELFKS